MSKKAIGIIGGMGPMATLDLFGKLIAHTDASCDAEHIRVYMDCNPGIPDRTAAILSGGASPVPYIVESAGKLAAMGADLLVIPCNTSHYFYDEIAAASPVPVLNMVRQTAQTLAEQGVTRVGVLATDGTMRTGVYERELSACGIETLCPTDNEQKAVMSLIYDGVKAGASTFDTAPIVSLVRRLTADGAERIVLGCTELPIGFSRYGIPLDNTVDPATVLACAAIRAAGYPVKR